MLIRNFAPAKIRMGLKIRKLSDRGDVNLLGLIWGSALAVSIFVFSAPWLLQTQNRQTADQATAQQIQTVSNALSGYVAAYYSLIEGVATATTPAVIPVSALISTHFLPVGYSATTPYGSTVVGQILQPSPGILVGAVVTQGGTAPAGAHLNQLANLIGAQGGFVPTANLSGLPGICGTNCFQGTGGIWRATFAQYPFTGVGPGSLISLQTFNDNNLQQDFLYRSSVPGDPQANQMQTNIDMNGNNLNNANQVQTYNLNSPNGTVNLDGNQLSNTGQINTNGSGVATNGGWIQTSGGWIYSGGLNTGQINSGNISSGSINTNGQPISAGSIYLGQTSPSACGTVLWSDISFGSAHRETIICGNFQTGSSLTLSGVCQGQTNCQIAVNQPNGSCCWYTTLPSWGGQAGTYLSASWLRNGILEGPILLW